MNTETILFLCKMQSSILAIPTKLYFGHDLVQSFNPLVSILNIDLDSLYIEQLFDTKQSVNYLVTTDLLLIGIVKDTTSPHSIVIGPARIGEMSENTVRKLITSDKYQLRLDQLVELTNYLHMLPHLHVDQFINILCFLYTSINHKTIPRTDIINSGVVYTTESEVEHNMLERDVKANFHGLQRRNPHGFEAELLFCIKHGMTAQLKKLGELGDTTQVGTLAFDTLRHYKNMFIALNTLSIRAAIAGGLSPETSYQLGEIYIQKIEACMDLKQLVKIGQALRMDYCERVRELQYPSTNDPGINKAVHYINENAHKKISAAEIADILSISRVYLSTRFKKVTGTSLPDYINRQKILEAKRLLCLTNKPLSEISEYLSFSSQSHFQSTFKKIEGMTPMEYRNTPDENII